jgi:hypothetical protein
MNEINRRAMSVPRERLVDEIKQANERKREVLMRRDRELGADRPKIGSYMENLALPGLYGFDMNDYYHDACLAMDIDLRNKLFWLDNSHDDGLASLEVGAGSMYYDMTLFELKINYTKDGVPIFERHDMADNPDLKQLKPFDFFQTGEMPMVHKRYHDLKRISEELYDGEVKVLFPAFRRGPMDIYVQLRQYQGFIEDCSEEPEYAHQLLDYIVDTRIRYNRLATEFLGEAPPGIQTMDDDWVNVPFISPAMFDEFAAPAYHKVQKAEGPIVRFHTCGVYGPVLRSLLQVYDGLESMDISGWNDLNEVDKAARGDVKFDVAYVNTFVLTGLPEEHRKKLEVAKKVAGHRRIQLHSQAIVKLLGTIDDSLVAMNRFIDLARKIMSE